MKIKPKAHALTVAVMVGIAFTIWAFVTYTAVACLVAAALMVVVFYFAVFQTIQQDLVDRRRWPKARK